MLIFVDEDYSKCFIVISLFSIFFYDKQYYLEPKKKKKV